MTPKNRRSIRLQGYDYSQEGAYYITVCTQDRLCLFGGVKHGEMVLNEIGQHVEKYWLEIPVHFPNTILHEYIVMPNHVHGIVEIVGTNDDLNVGANNHLPGVNNHLSDMTNNHLPGVSDRAKDISPLRGTSKTIGSIVRGFKIGVTKYIRAHTDIYDVWQRSFYDHIIRDGDDYERIANYIINNPKNWDQDDLYL